MCERRLQGDVVHALTIYAVAAFVHVPRKDGDNAAETVLVQNLHDFLAVPAHRAERGGARVERQVREDNHPVVAVHRLPHLLLQPLALALADRSVERH
eukprot:3908743-Pleurochrysis_carterae.AAC.2